MQYTFMLHILNNNKQQHEQREKQAFKIIELNSPLKIKR